MCSPEKGRGNNPFTAEQSVLRSPVCLGIIAKYGHVSLSSRETGANFLCTSDCVAERQGFEPSVQLIEPVKPDVCVGYRGWALGEFSATARSPPSHTKQCGFMLS